jgi:hypothetical protein
MISDRKEKGTAILNNSSEWNIFDQGSVKSEGKNNTLNKNNPK